MLGPYSELVLWFQISAKGITMAGKRYETKAK
jgi:hypothetical protein